MKKSILETVKQIRSGEVTAVEIYEGLISRITEFDENIRSYVTLNPLAEKETRILDEMVAHGKFRGPLHGIPVSVKDLIDTAGIRTTYGNSRFNSNIPKRDAAVVSHLKKSGAYVLGKTNTHEFALGIGTFPTVNPYDFSRIPGGSSGGSAAALAAEMSVFALGSDTGGSIRIPAAMCGITGLKPTYGKIPTDGVFPESWTLDHIGPMVRFAEDLPLVMEAMGAPIKRFRNRTRLKAGIIGDYFESSDRRVSNTVSHAIDKLESEGKIEVFHVGSEILQESMKFHEVIDTSEIATVHRTRYESEREVFTESSREQIESGMKRSAVEYIEAIRKRDALYEKLKEEMKGVDLLISPTLPKTAPTRKDLQSKYSADHDSHVSFQSEFNYFGMPAISIPCGFVDGLPVGLQVASERDRDPVVINLAIEFQKLTDWHLRSPVL